MMSVILSVDAANPNYPIPKPGFAEVGENPKFDGRLSDLDRTLVSI